MKKNSLKKAFSVIAMAAVAVSASSAVVNAAEEVYSPDGGFSAAQIAGSAVKPVTEVTKIVVGKDQAGQKVEVKINLTGANAKYCSTGMHFYYDSRLEIEKNVFGEAKVNKASEGELGTEYLGTIKIQEDPTASDFNNATTKWSGVFFATAESANKGLDGLLYKMNFTIPADAKEGDVYPIDVVYRSNKNAKDLFTNKENDEAGKLMQAYFFTQGIYNDARKYDASSDPSFVATVMDGSTYDGYIAINTIAPTDAPTEAPTAAPTAAPTEAPTAAPTAAPTEAPTTPVSTAAPTEAPTGGTGTTVAGTGAATTAAGTGATTAAGTGATTAKPATTAAPATTAKPTDAPKTGVPGAGVAVAGLAAAIGTAFVLRRRED